MPAPVGQKINRDADGTETYRTDLYRMPGGKGTGRAGDYLRALARRELGRGIAARWFR